MTDAEALYARLAEVSLPPERGERPLTFVETEVVRRSIGQSRTFARVSLARRLVGKLDVAALSFAVDIVARRHDAMWTWFPRTDGEPIARTDPEVRPQLVVLDAPDEATGRQLLDAEYFAGFDLDAPPLYRFLLVRISPELHLFLIVAHHIACDFLTFTVVTRELGVVYAARVNGGSAMLPPLKVHGRMLPFWQRLWFTDEVRERYGRFWHAQLPTRPLPPTLHGMKPAPSEPLRHERRALDLTAPHATAEALAALAHTHAVPRRALLAAATAITLHGESGSDEIVLGLFFHNRHKPTISLVGNTVELLPLRIELAAGERFLDVATRLYDQLEQMKVHQDVPPSATGTLEPWRRAHRALFNYLGHPSSSAHVLSLVGVRAEVFHMPLDQGMFFDLELRLVLPSAHDVSAKLFYNATLVEADLARSFLERFWAVVGRATERPELPIDALLVRA